MEFFTPTGWLLAGPTMIGFSYLLHQANIENYKFPFLVFIIFFNLWAYWHVVRQHFGIMSLYKKKNGDYEPVDTRIDKAILYVGLLAPFVSFIFRHPEARKALGLSSAFPPYPAVNSISKFFSANFLAQLQWEHIIVFLSVAAFSTVSVAFIGRQLYRWRNGLPLNMPKIFFMIALIPLYAIINYSAAILTAPLLAFSAFVTIYHDVQYHAIVWFYSKNRYHKPGLEAKKYGLATKMTKNFATYMMCGIAMAAIFRLFGCSFQVHPGCGVLVITSDQLLFGSISSRELLYGLLLGIPMHHYFVDQYIWRPSKDATLQKDLKLNQ
jgi:hypothetical protein